MKEEKGAGGIVIKSINGQYHVLLIADRYGFWTFPKGRIDQGERAVISAKREITEETGITRLKVAAPLSLVRYVYTDSNNELVSKVVEFFLFITTDNAQPILQESEGIRDVRWVTFAQAREMIGHQQTLRPLLDEALEVLQNYVTSL